MLTTTLLATRATIYVAPAMNVHMYQNQAVIENMQKLTRFGYHFIEPGAGYLACGYVGKGRLEEPITIIDVIQKHENNKSLLSGKKVLITAGPTREAVDPEIGRASCRERGWSWGDEARGKGTRRRERAQQEQRWREVISEVWVYE